jgi:hypothetical protein
LKIKQRNAIRWLFHKDNPDMDLYWAYKKARYRGSRKAAWKLFNKPNVRKAVQEKIAEIEKEAILSRKDLLKQLDYLVMFDPAKLFHEDGRPKKIWEIDYETRMALAKLKYKTSIKGEVYFDEIKNWDKNQAIKTAGQFRGMTNREIDKPTRGNV